MSYSEDTTTLVYPRVKKYLDKYIRRKRGSSTYLSDGNNAKDCAKIYGQIDGSRKLLGKEKGSRRILPLLHLGTLGTCIVVVCLLSST